jgi:hypothetical protein
MKLLCCSFFKKDGKMNTQAVIFTIAFGFLMFMLYSTEAQAIGCFVCASFNGSQPDCEDSFNNTGKYYNPNCHAGRKRRYGLFPGTECVKLKGTIQSNGVEVVLRTCVVDNGDVNSETEIGRSNHCGLINYMMYDSQPMSGCVLSCNTDGCNSAKSNWPSKYVILLLTVLSLTIWQNN